MNFSRLQAWVKKDGWLLAALLLCVALCLGLSAASSPGTEEDRISRVLSAMAGAGKVEVAVYYEDSVPCGAVVVAGGAGDIAVQLRLTDAVTTLLGLEPGRVAVYQSNGGKTK